MEDTLTVLRTGVVGADAMRAARSDRRNLSIYKNLVNLEFYQKRWYALLHGLEFEQLNNRRRTSCLGST